MAYKSIRGCKRTLEECKGSAREDLPCDVASISVRKSLDTGRRFAQTGASSECEEATPQSLGDVALYLWRHPRRTVPRWSCFHSSHDRLSHGAHENREVGTENEDNHHDYVCPDLDYRVT